MTYEELALPPPGSRVVVGMSGGVDSTLALMLLRERGCLVTGVTMSLWKGDMPDIPQGTTVHDSCYGPGEAEDIAQCQSLCQSLGVPYHVIDVKDAYQREVLDYFKAEYRAGRTPNPCIRCNSFIKFGALLAGIQTMGLDYDYFCTGHYARIVRGTQAIGSLYGDDTSPHARERPALIAQASDSAKDQSYFLCRIPSPVLEKVRFPLKSYTKREVFRMARERNLAAASREESQDFIAEPYLDHLFSDKPSVPGDIIDLDGNVLGQHRGIEHYTIGQRRGLGVSAKQPLYVAGIDAAHNTVILGRDEDLLCPALIADDFVWPAGYEPTTAFQALVKIRLASRPVVATVQPYQPQDGEQFKGNAWRITFEASQRAVAPGQSVVLYKDGVTIGGGIICRQASV